MLLLYHHFLLYGFPLYYFIYVHKLSVFKLLFSFIIMATSLAPSLPITLQSNIRTRLPKLRNSKVELDIMANDSSFIPFESILLWSIAIEHCTDKKFY